MKLEEIESEFRWARRLTLDLLAFCSSTDLLFSPESVYSPLWKQFRHVGRVHENYLQALETTVIRFSTEGCSYVGGASRAELTRYFFTLDALQKKALRKIGTTKTINWFGEFKSVESHFLSLLSHETLHHGQLILYWRSLGKEFPASWSDWGE